MAYFWVLLRVHLCPLMNLFLHWVATGGMYFFLYSSFSIPLGWIVLLNKHLKFYVLETKHAILPLRIQFIHLKLGILITVLGRTEDEFESTLAIITWQGLLLLLLISILFW